MGREYQCEFVIEKPVIEIFEYLSKLTEIAKFKMDFVDSKTFRIYLHSKVSLSSFGENITILLSDNIDGGTKLLVNSKSKLVTIVIDFGKNENNVNEIEAFIKSVYDGEAVKSPV